MVIGKVWKGTAFGGTRGRTQLPGYVDKYLEGTLKIDEFISGSLPLERVWPFCVRIFAMFFFCLQVNEAFELMHQKKSIRTMVVLPHEGDEEVAAHRRKFV